MKRFFIICILLAAFAGGVAQNEFDIYKNGLIYNDTTIRQLRFIVDSLNLKFKVCDLNRQYFGKAQARAHYVEVEKRRVKEAQKDMENNMAFEEFVRKYNCTAEKDLLVVKFRYKDYDEKDVVEFSSIEMGDQNSHEMNFDDPTMYHQSFKGKWAHTYYEKSDYSEESVSGFYFTEEFSSPKLTLPYARMVQYSECMVDTSTDIFLDKAERTGRYYKSKETKKVSAFIEMVHKATGMPEYEEGDNYYEKYAIWDSLRFIKLDSVSKTPAFIKLLSDAVSEAKESGGSYDEFEEYVAKYYSGKAALEMKRNRIVVGGCSMDNSPRVHAANIAVLAAQTVSWEVFLRAHLNIMNDRFERASDGSYAWAGRKTYIKELEVLDINLTDLLMGISLRIENPSKNHYYGSIGRLGRALSESEKPAEIEKKMLDMVADNTLDNYNRVIIYYLFLNYNYYLTNADKKKENVARLNDAVQKMPEHLSAKMKVTYKD